MATTAPRKKSRYVHTGIVITKNQGERLREGLPIRIKANQLQDGDGRATDLYLTNRQLNKIDKAIEGRKGVNLKLSKTQTIYTINQ